MARWLSIGFFGISAVGFALMVYVFSEWNQTPAKVPLPGAGYSVAETFHISTGGRFELRAQVPVVVPDDGPVAMATQPPIPVRLRLEIDQDGITKSNVSISNLDHIGRYGFGRMDLYAAEPSVTLARGDYVVRLTGLDRTIAPEGGAMLSLERVANPTTTYLLANLVRILSWCFFVLGIGFLLWSARTPRSKPPRSAV